MLHPDPTTRAAGARRGFTIVEIMVSLLILTVVSSSVVMSMVNLGQAERSAKDRAQAQQLARTLAERVMGGNWDTLAFPVSNVTLSNQNSWSWHRREHPSGPSANPPMDETSAVDTSRIDFKPVPPPFPSAPLPPGNPTSAALLSLARDPIHPNYYIGAKTGLRNLKIYLEYYKYDLMTQMLAATGNPTPKEVWDAAVASSTGPNVYDDTNLMDLRAVSDPVLVRILVTWMGQGDEVDPNSGVVAHLNRYELVFVRRK